MEQLLYLTTTSAGGDLNRASREALRGAMEWASALDDTELSIGLIGEDVQTAADSLTGCGAVKILAVEGEAFGVSRYSTDAVAATALIEATQATLVVAPADARLSRVLPGVAQRVGGRIDTQVTEVATAEGVPQIERWHYRQRLVARITRSQRPWIVLVASGVHPAYAGEVGAASVEKLDVSVPETRTQVQGVEAASAGAQTIRPEADLLFVAGAGWTKAQAGGEIRVAEAEDLIGTLLEKASASLGSSKSLVEQSGEGQQVISFMSHMNQVGQTGSTPRHPKGLATCCHGEEPHAVGWRFIGERRAVNLDANCGWAHGKADVLYVADAFEVLEELNKLL